MHVRKAPVEVDHVLSIRRSIWLAAVASVILFGGCSEDAGPRLPLGRDCSSYKNEDCISGLCLRLDSATAYCTQTCSREEQNCPSGFICQSTANPSGYHCVQRGANCNEDADCPAGHRCDTSPGPGEGICYIPVARGLCAPCSSSYQCPDGGTCLEIPTTGERLCTIPCDDDCPEGYECVDVQGAGEQCLPIRRTCDDGRPICSSCRGDAECGGFRDRCLHNLATGERFCGIDCESSAGGAPVHDVCPVNFGCMDISGEGAGPWQCVPNARTCGGYCDAGTDDIARAEAQCGFGRMCEVESNSCLDADDGRLCAPCADDDDCRKMSGSTGNLCMANRHTGETFCGRSCGEGQMPCPAGFSCVEVEAIGEMHYQCLPTRGTCRSGTGRLGDGCGSGGADDCLTGICLDFGAVALCSARCTEDADCGDAGAAYQCCGLSPDRDEFDCSASPDGEGVCAPLGGEFGDDCSPGRSPCRSGLCLDIGTARLCTLGCQGNEDCPEGFSCQAGQGIDGDPIMICFPSGGGEIGSDCTFGPAACDSRLCISRGGQGSNNVCTIPCPDDRACPGDWVCDEQAQTIDSNVGGEGVNYIAVCVPPELRPRNL